MHAFRDLATAAYCPRKLYYRRRDVNDTPPGVRELRALAFRYPELLASPNGPDGDPLRDAPIAVTPTQFRANLGSAKARLDVWPELADPPGRSVFLEGRECRGIAHKVLESPPVPSLVFAGRPPEEGVWHPQAVHAVAAAKALSWEREIPVERTFVEYPAEGRIREVRLTTRRKASYRTAIRAVESIDGPPPRLSNGAKCDPCEYREECGVETRSLRSLLRSGTDT